MEHVKRSQDLHIRKSNPNTNYETSLPTQADDINDDNANEMAYSKIHRMKLPVDEFSRESYVDLDKYPVRECKFYIRGLQDPVTFNPLVTLISVSLLWGVVIWTIVDPEGSLEKIISLRGQISLHFTWLFMGSKAIFFFFMMWIAYRYGHIKLGHQHEIPEFSTQTYFCIIFATGVASGFFVFSVAEPLWHQNSHFYANAGYRSQDEIDMFAINMTVTNWAISGWTGYAIVAACVSLATHRFKLPLTIRSCFYPILRDYTWGWIGDFIDGISIVIAVAGICTSLGLGAVEIVSGFIYLGWVDRYSRQDHITSIETTTVWVISIVCIASVISGVHGGIRLLSIIALLLGFFLLCIVFLLDDSKFLLNLIVQEFGYYLQYSVFLLNFWTDAFGQLREGSGRAIDGKAAEQWWMDSWMVFYQAWWLAWSGFVGLMVARVSLGRTLRELIVYCMIVPCLVCLVWFSIWGGIGLRQSRQAMELELLGSDYFNNSRYFLAPDSEFCYVVPQDNVVIDNEVIFVNHLPGITPVCQFDSTRPSWASFNVLYSFSFPQSFKGSGFGPTLAVMFIIALTLFFVTSSDSTSLVVDILASNGSHSHHWIRRLFWSVTQGALATALLSSGGATALLAVQAASVVCGLPWIVLLMFMIQSITVFCQAAEQLSCDEEYTFPDQPEFSTPVFGGVFNAMEYISSLGNVNRIRVDRGIDKPTKQHTIEFAKGMLSPFVSLYQILQVTYPTNPSTNANVSFVYGVLYIGWVVTLSLSRSYPGLAPWAGTEFIACGIILGQIRSNFRSMHNLRSNIVSDFVAGLLLWPQVLTQLRIHCIELQPRKEKQEEAPRSWSPDVGESQSVILF